MNDTKFIYNSYNIREDEKKIYFEFDFEIDNVSKFLPKYEILKKDFKWKHLKSNVLKNLVFNLGMIEAISYYKAICSRNFFIKCGYLNKEQERWFRKLFYLGLGEFRYINNIKTTEEDFVNFISLGKKIDLEEELINEKIQESVFIPVGGGKDSNVTLELLKNKLKNVKPFLINGKEVSYECIKTAGFSKNEIIEVNRILDKKIIELNNKGYLNGHTPFSAMVAFLSYTVAFINGTQYIALSNENSANESNVKGEKINHQYSKSLEFEDDFRFYCKKYLKAGNIEYFSFLRPISELQIAKLFSKFPKYYEKFKSCNVGSKNSKWNWCGKCPKCLFVYIILSPFIEKNKMIEIFGNDLLDRKEFENTFLELCGFSEIKPFECVGTYSEVRYAVNKCIQNFINNNEKIPYLLGYYLNLDKAKEYCKLYSEELKDNRLKEYNVNNNLPEKFNNILKKVII